MEEVAAFFLRVVLLGAGVILNAGGITQPYIQTLINDAWRANLETPLSPEAAAVAVLKGWLTPEGGAYEASNVGLSGDRFQTLVDSAGEPLPVQQGAEAVRRGLMDNARFIKLLQESRYRVEWADMFIALQHGPPSPANAIAGRVQGHLDDATARTIVSEGGIDPANYDWLLATAGRPPGTEEMIKLLRRDVVTEADVTTAIQESNVKNKYIPAILQTRLAVPPLFQVFRMLQSGGIDAATATKYLLWDGYDATVAAGIVHAATGAKVAAHKQESEGLIVSGYKAAAIDNATATAHLVAIGYDATQAAFILSVADHQVAKAEMDRAANRVGTIYQHGRIDRATAAGDLATLGVPGAAAARLLSEWDLERATLVKVPTVAQLGAMVKKSLITAGEMQTRLVNEGYSAADAALIVALY